MIHTTNSLECVNRELKCRTRVFGIFPSPAACLRPVTTIAIGISDEWFTNRAYLTMEPSINGQLLPFHVDARSRIYRNGVA